MKTKRKKRRALLLAFIIIALLAAELTWSNFAITVSRYEVRSEKAEGNIRIVALSDLHCRELGSGNRRLLKKIEEEQPDIIVLAGDIFGCDANEKQVERTLAFVSAAVEIAPVYYGMGNHEYKYMDGIDASLAEKIAATGAILLDDEYMDIDINGTAVRIGGYEGYYRTPHLDTQDEESKSRKWRFCKDFENSDDFKLLINHIPTNWLDWGYRDKYPVDLVISGHYHGGNARIPFTDRGVYAPYVKWFPPYTKGCFEGEKATCILTTGLAGGAHLPRVFNPPEIVVVDVTAK